MPRYRVEYVKYNMCFLLHNRPVHFFPLRQVFIISHSNDTNLHAKCPVLVCAVNRKQNIMKLTNVRFYDDHSDGSRAVSF